MQINTIEPELGSNHDEITSSNEVMLTAIAKIAARTINKLSSDKKDILYCPDSISELEENTSMLSNIISIKIKNSIIKN